MKKFKVADFDGWGNQHEKLAKFVNENNIQPENIIKIMYGPSNVMLLFYYIEE
jgi:hypothetical protein